MFGQPLVNREHELDQLRQVATGVRDGRGALVLLSGDAGIGKTRLVEEARRASDVLMLRGHATRFGEAPYGPIVAALRSYLRRPDGAPVDIGHLTPHLALLLPELGQQSPQSEQATLFEAIRQAFVTIGRRQPILVFLDDLQWADGATLELLPLLDSWIEHQPIAIVAAYRSDDVPRGHRIRRMRTDLRRAGRLREISIAPLGPQETALLAAHVLGKAPGPALRDAIYDRTQGIPFFVEELATALLESGHLVRSDKEIELSANTWVPAPDTVRDAILLRTEDLTPEARQALGVASALGAEFDLDLLIELAGDAAGLIQPLERGLIVETRRGRAAFRHDLVREAIYGELPWPRRRMLHRRIAARMELRGAPAAEVAEHWLSARDFPRACRSLIGAAEASQLVHAYRDAAHAYRQALDIWPNTNDEATRIDALSRLARCAELSGELQEAARIWREVVQWRQSNGEHERVAQALRQLATVYEIEGAWERATITRREAAEAFAAYNAHAEAASERISAAEHLENSGAFRAVIDLAIAAAREADQAKRFDLKALALGLEGQARANLGQIERGLELIRDGLALSLEHNLTDAAAVLYFQLASSLDQASEYAAARDAYLSAIDFCRTHGVASIEHVCLACFSVVLRQTGEWDHATSICREVLESDEAPPVARAIAAGILGCILELRGNRRKARRLLLEAHSQAQHHQIVTLEIETAGSLILAEARAGDADMASSYCQVVRERWEQTEERHYAISPLRWAATFYATRGAKRDAGACAHALADIASTTGNPEALAGLAFALGECALADGETRQASQHFAHALQLLSRLELPFVRAQTQLRAGVAAAMAGEHQKAVDLLTSAYRTARKLKARPLAGLTAQELDALGVRIDQRLGRSAASHLRQQGLTPREREVLRLVSQGLTSREIARQLFLSPRTVEMHVGNILAKLDCRSRAEATRKAHELRLLTPDHGDAPAPI